MNRISRNISIILRTERMIARRQMSIMASQSGLYALAGLVLLIALVLLDVAAFFALSTRMSPQVAALVLAVANMVLAGLLVWIARRLTPGKEMEPATEVRDMAIAELEAEVEDVVGEVRELSDNVRRIARDPLGAALPSLLGPLISILLGGKKK